MPNVPPSWQQAASTAAFAVALTAIMGVALFVTVGMNPKSHEYSYLPWYYAAGCAVAALFFHRLSRWLDRPAPGVVPSELRTTTEK
ncbi:MAG: hypothetical protein RMJ56_15685 [Gemmataceae bacterium]|nr:hypothetical protein [Gemmata sp.]MDW8199038.1 hypothetical protein [Gemmataceae bacterium]